MTIDHIAWEFLSTETVSGQICHFFGRIAFPITAYFLVEGYQHTRSVPRYALRLFGFALLSWLPFSFFTYGRIIPHFGILYTLGLGLLAIWFLDRANVSPWGKSVGLLIIFALSFWGDWAFFGVAFCVLFWWYRDNPQKMWLAYAVISVVIVGMNLSGGTWWEGIYAFGLALPPILLTRYHGKTSVKRHPAQKWIFYAYYPAHLIVLCVLQNLLAT